MHRSQAEMSIASHATAALLRLRRMRREVDSMTQTVKGISSTAVLLFSATPLLQLEAGQEANGSSVQFHEGTASLAGT